MEGKGVSDEHLYASLRMDLMCPIERTAAFTGTARETYDIKNASWLSPVERLVRQHLFLAERTGVVAESRYRNVCCLDCSVKRG